MLIHLWATKLVEINILRRDIGPTADWTVPRHKLITKRGRTHSFDRRLTGFCCCFTSETRTKGIPALPRHRSGTTQASYNNYTTRMKDTLASSRSSSARIADLQFIILPYTIFGRAMRHFAKKRKGDGRTGYDWIFDTKFAFRRKALVFIKMMRETHGGSIKWSRRGSVYNFHLQMDGKFRTVCKQADIYYILAMYLYLKQDFIALIQATSAPRSPSHHHQVTRS